MSDAFDEAAEEAIQSPKSRKAVDKSCPSQLDFEIEFFERILKTNSDYVDVLRVHANNLSAKGQYARGLRADRLLVRLCPDDPIAHYNLACTYARLHMNDAAIASLDCSLRLGYRDLEHMLSDPDLEQLRKDARFIGLLGRYLVKSKPYRKSR